MPRNTQETDNIKVALLAGGLGTRIMEETRARPKPMVEIGGQPILRHIMGLYADQGFGHFVVALGYMGEVIREHFRNHPAPWQVDLVDTGAETMTGGRLRRLRPYLQDGTFMLTYGDGVSSVDAEELLRFHRSHGRIATLTAVHPPERTTRLVLGGDHVSGFRSTDQGEGWINGGFFVFEPAIFDYLHDDSDSLESIALTRLAREGQLMAYQHSGFWQCMDTVVERNLLESIWSSGKAPWAQTREPALT
jgi:glucose-1-phosphate cytidylyltransferase